ncbi:MAG: DEAD/DEAH box helicase [Bacteriovoracaceae bacterium]|jgi:superfamily II DNA/RNA helicase|nr:DEAD/DEAH box helicase [Bacteriovoracaceae bacterium]
MSFEKLGIDEDFNGYYAEIGIKSPNEVQTKVIPKILDHKNVLCVAQTGSGKTLSYALPISELIKLHEDENGVNPKNGRPMAVIVTPTKELASQIFKVFKEISHHGKLRIRNLLGGQKKTLKTQGFEILVATPTKLAMHIKSKDVNLSDLKYLIFDEADTLFEMGFKKDINTIVSKVDYDETNIHFFSATLATSIEEYLNQKFAKINFEKVTFSTTGKLHGKIDTFNLYTSVKERLEFLTAFLDKTAKGRGVIFANQKNQVDEIAKHITDTGSKIKFIKLHGDMSKEDRAKSYEDFSSGKGQVLIASDIAARGIDIKDLKWVLNFNLPRTAEFYLHRCGRVGRAGKHGVVYNFVTHYDAKLIGHINMAIKGQSSLNLDFIAKDITEAKAKSLKKKKKKVKTKRVKITKRTRI